MAHQSTLSSESSEIIPTGVVRVPNSTLEFRVPQTADVPTSTLRLVFGDKARGVVDHYVLFSSNDVDDPTAAVMVTELPGYVDTPQKALRAAVASERGYVQGTAARPILERVSTAWGEGLDLFVPNRVGSPCFPAARYRLASDAKPTIGLSRFITTPGLPIQFVVSVSVPPEMPAEAPMDHARRVMDTFIAGLRPP